MRRITMNSITAVTAVIAIVLIAKGSEVPIWASALAGSLFVFAWIFKP